MSHTKTTWVEGVTPWSIANFNNLETQYDDANADFGHIGIYGDGSDGDVTISGDTTLSRDMYYNNLTVNNTKILNTGGFRIFVKNTLANNGEISRAGIAATNYLGAAALSAGSLGGSSAGGNGKYNISYLQAYGGGGGGGGGVMLIAARILINNGTITVKGGNGANGFATAPDMSTQSGAGVAGTNQTNALGNAGGNGGATNVATISNRRLLSQLFNV